MISISNTRLPSFLEGQQILVWDAPLQKRVFKKLFGNAVEVGMLDIAPEIGKVIPQTAEKSLLRIKELSKIAKYCETELSELDVFVNLFTSFVQLREKSAAAGEAGELQLAALGTIADIMPLVDENRIIIKKGLLALKTKPLPGLAELLFKLELSGKRYNARDISWKLCPSINAARRMGHPEIAANLFFEKNTVERDKIAQELLDMNEGRRSMEDDVWKIAEPLAFENFLQLDNKLAFAYGEDINKGVTGLIAQRLARHYNVPALVVSLNDNICTGSLRSARGYNVGALLEQCSDLFIDSGGHEFAAGFSIYKSKDSSYEKSNWDLFLERLQAIIPTIELSEGDDEESIAIDAELPLSFITPDIYKIIDLFEPYGNENEALVFLAKNLIISDISLVGRTESKHLKMTLDTGKHKWPAMYWQAAERVINKEFELGDRVDLVFNFTRDWYKEMENFQMIISDLKKSE